MMKKNLIPKVKREKTFLLIDHDLEKQLFLKKDFLKQELVRTTNSYKLNNVKAVKILGVDPNLLALIEPSSSPERLRERKHAIIRMSFFLAQGKPGTSTIILRGYKGLSLLLKDNTEPFSPALLTKLHEMVNWLSSDPESNKMQVLLEELSVSLSEKETFIQGLENHLTQCLEQSKKRHLLVLENGNYYHSDERSRILKEINDESVIYQRKLTSLTTRLLRDVLMAALVTAVIFSLPLSPKLIYWCIKSIGACMTFYFILYPLARSMKDAILILISKNKILHWKCTMAELISEEEYNSFIHRPLKNINLTLWVGYPLLLCISLIFACACFRLPEWLDLLKQI